MMILYRYLDGSADRKQDVESMKGRYEELQMALDMVGFTDEVREREWLCCPNGGKLNLKIRM